MKIKALLLAFGGGKIREIDIPEDKLNAIEPKSAVLGLAFKYGQDDFQPKPFPSVSVGDVIELPDGSLHRVDPIGFTKVRFCADERHDAPCIYDGCAACEAECEPPACATSTRPACTSA